MSPEPHHLLRVQGSRGAIYLDVTLKLTAPWTVIFGPSGSGKSSLLRAACGLTPDLKTDFERGRSSLQGLPPHQRALAYAPQGGAVFPHLSVRKNIAFPQHSRNTPDAADSFDDAIELFSLEPLLNRSPKSLSGGERQAVALARAFAVPNTQLMLLDEPFNGIGRTTRDVLLSRMKARLATLKVPAVSVTHDVEEAFLLDAEVIRIEEGKIVARGQAADVLHEERAALKRNIRG